MKPLLAGIQKEWKLIFRNGISLYMAAAPAILAVIFVLVFGAIQEATLSVAVDNTVSVSERAMLEKAFDVEAFASKEEMLARIEGVDSIVGVTRENGEITVIAEGNEGREFMLSMQAAVGNALYAQPLSYTERTVAGQGDFAFRFCLICVYLLSLFIGGSTVGLTSVGERESGVIRAIAISPISLARYIAGKLVPAVTLGVVGVICVTLITGHTGVLFGMVALSVASIFVCGLSAFILPAFAGNQIAAVGVLKLSMPLMLVLPLSAMFVPAKWQVLYYIFPMYWQYRSIDGLLSGGEWMMPLLMTILVAIPWFAAIMLYFANKVKIK